MPRSALYLIVAMVACSKAEGQSYRDGMSTLCGALTSSGAIQQHPAERGRVVSEWVPQHVRNPEVLAMFGAFGRTREDDRRALEEAAGKAGVTPCELLTIFDPPPSEPEP